jgi:hypothetical protein
MLGPAWRVGRGRQWERALSTRAGTGREKQNGTGAGGEGQVGQGQGGTGSGVRKSVGLVCWSTGWAPSRPTRGRPLQRGATAWMAASFAGRQHKYDLQGRVATAALHAAMRSVPPCPPI